MASVLKRIEYLNKIFDGIKLNVRSKITDEIEDMFNIKNEYRDLYKEPKEEDLIITLKVLEQALKEAKKDYKEAKKRVKNGTLHEDELFGYKQAVDDLVTQIKEIKSNLGG